MKSMIPTLRVQRSGDQVLFELGLPDKSIEAVVTLDRAREIHEALALVLLDDDGIRDGRLFPTPSVEDIVSKEDLLSSVRVASVNDGLIAIAEGQGQLRNWASAFHYAASAVRDRVKIRAKDLRKRNKSKAASGLKVPVLGRDSNK